MHFLSLKRGADLHAVSSLYVKSLGSVYINCLQETIPTNDDNAVAKEFSKFDDDDQALDEAFEFFNTTVMHSRSKDGDREYVKQNCNIMSKQHSHYDQSFYSELFGINNATYMQQINSAILHLHLAKSRSPQENGYKKKEISSLFMLYEGLNGVMLRKENLVVSLDKVENTSEFCHAAALTFDVWEIITKKLKYDTNLVRDFYKRRVKESREAHLVALMKTNAEPNSVAMTSRKPYPGNFDSFLARAPKRHVVLGCVLVVATLVILGLLLSKGSFVSSYLICSSLPRSITSRIFSTQGNQSQVPAAVSQQVSWV